MDGVPQRRSPRDLLHGAWLAGAWLLLGLAIAAIGTSVLYGGGLMVIGLAVPLFAAGYFVLRSMPWARVIGVAVAAVCAAALAFVATTQLRGLRPPPGQTAPGPDPLTLAVAVCFAVAAVFILVGKSAPTAGAAGPASRIR